MSKCIEIPVQCGLAGRYKLTVRHADLRIKHETGWFDNLITDAGLNFKGNNSSWLQWCFVGSGTAAPADSDTALSSEVASTSTLQAFASAAQSTLPYYGSQTNTYRFAEGAAAGNLSEVGIGPEAPDPLFSRALITDSNGDPTTITVLSDEVLDVTYEVRVIPPTTDQTFQVTDSGPAGTVHNVVVRAAEVTAAAQSTASTGWGTTAVGTSAFLLSSAGPQPRVYDGALGAITESPNGTVGRADSQSTDAYSNNSLERTGSAVWGLNGGNFGSGGITAVRFGFGASGMWQASFDPAILKTSSDTLTLGFKISWSRATV